MRRLVPVALAAPAALAAAGCATAEPAPNPAQASNPAPNPAPAPNPVEPGQRVCDAGPVQDLIGEKATPEIGARILAESGARTLRWGPPRSAWTMDYRVDRVNVRYDDDMVIEAITCG
ncbi:MAG: I78 family peptidase inhibitor [Hoeflea sp.]